MILTLKDGGKLIIKDSQLEAWNKIYKINSTAVIRDLESRGIFNRCSKNKALKTINKALREVKTEGTYNED